MTRTTRELLAALAVLNQEVPGVVLGILDHSLPPEKQVEFGRRLTDVGQALQRHAKADRPVVVDSDDH
jgi:hypothetical protein